MKRIKVPSVKVKGWCSARPPLVMDERRINPMLLCNLKPKHKGPHSWEPKR